MPVTVNKGYSVPTPGTESGTWGTDLNTNTFAVIDSNLGGTVYVGVSNTNITLTAPQAQNGIIRLGGTLTANVTVAFTGPGLYAIRNETTGNFLLSVIGPVGTAKYIPQGMSTFIHVDYSVGAFIAGQRTSTVGMIAPFCGSNVPPGWLLCDSSLISRTIYNDLWVYAQNSGNMQTDANWLSGQYFGAFSYGDGVTNFRLPDLRGVFLRGYAGTNVNFDVGRVCSTLQYDGVKNHIHPAGSVVTDPGHSHPNSVPANSGYNTVGGSTQMSNSTRSATNPANTGITVATTISNNTGGTAENRPVNLAFVYCISIG